MAKKYFITTAIDYIDDVMHIGHAYQKIVADVLARYHRLKGENVFFLTGVDEHGGKAEEAAKKAKASFKKWADKISQADKEEFKSLNIAYNRFIRTTDKDHQKTVLDFWQKVEKRGDLYLGKYTGIYCQGCESFITKKDLVANKCPYHPTKAPKKLTEKNYFFRWKKYEDFLKNHIRKNPEFIKPEVRRNEMISFLNQGLEDIPVSRPSVKWGLRVPDHPKHTIYVWFEALINYLTGAPKGFWPADLHILGKDNLRWHALLWPAMLKSTGYKLPKTVYAHDFFTFNGQKISKSLGNVIRPSALVEKFGTDGIRYYFIKYGPIARDVDLTLKKLKEVYNADLANGLGNLVARVAKLCEKSSITFPEKESHFYKNHQGKTSRLLDEYKFNEALTFLWTHLGKLDKEIDRTKPWTKKGKDLEKILKKLVVEIQQIATALEPFIPEASRKIQKQFKGPKIRSEKPLFPRLK